MDFRIGSFYCATVGGDEKLLACRQMFTFIRNLSIFLTSTAFVDTNAKYGTPLSRYTVFLQNRPLGYAPKGLVFLLFGLIIQREW
jgi:hypothetical protein